MPLTAAPPMQTAQDAGRILELLEVTEDLRIFRLAKPPGLEFWPGQSIKLGSGGVSRRYSIASAPHQPHLEFCIEKVPGGRFTPKLWQMNAGDRLEIGPRPKGSLRLESSAKWHLMLATVTGIAPFMSMLRQHFHAPTAGRRFWLFHGASHVRELVYREELRAMAAEHPHELQYIPAISRPEAPGNQGWGGETGRLPAVLQQHMDRFDPAPMPLHAYACGHPGMIATVRDRLTLAGHQTSTEAYWSL